jgi:hypothetical protein
MSLLTASATRFENPHFRAAGKVIALGPNENTEYCLKADLYKNQDAPGTPEHIKKYRKSF